MLKKIIKELDARDLSDWQVREVRKQSDQSFLAREKARVRALGGHGSLRW